LLKHLNDFGAKGWELVWMAVNVDLARGGVPHLLVFKQAGQ